LKNRPAGARLPKPPKGLSAEARRLWRRLVEDYSIEDQAGELLLQTGLEAFDRMRLAQEQIKRDGQTSTDRFGQVKAHPLLVVERDARSAMVQSLKALNLDLEPLRDAGRRG
jgi:P27 family predicted phage terminase small subunit